MKHAKRIKGYLLRLGLLTSILKLQAMILGGRKAVLQQVYPAGKFVSCNRARVYVDFGDPNFAWYFGTNRFLSQEHQGFSSLLKLRRPNVVLDIGAHWGVFPAMLEADADLPSDVKRVVCIEPDKKNIPTLRKTVSIIRKFKVDIVECAVSDREGFINARRGGGSCLQTYGGDDSNCNERVRAAPLQKILEELAISDGEVTHIKLDIDGYEPAFFYGAREFLLRNKPYLLIEFWAKGLRESGYDIKEYWKFLTSIYDIYELEYPGGTCKRMESDRLGYLENKTIDAVVNLLLHPR